MKDLIISPQASIDIDSIYDYTESHWGQDQAEDYTFGIRQALEDICRGTRGASPSLISAAASSPFPTAPTI